MVEIKEYEKFNLKRDCENRIKSKSIEHLKEEGKTFEAKEKEVEDQIGSKLEMS